MVEFQVSPKADSKTSHTDPGSQICGTVESTKANIPSFKSLVLDVDDVVLLVSMEETPMRRSRDMSV